MLESTESTAALERSEIERERFIRLMAETLPLAGYAGVHADLPGWDAPELVHGAVRDHRPSIFCEGPCPVYLDVLPPGGISLQEIASRWQLFASAAELSHGQFQVVVPRWIAGRDGRGLAKQIAELVGVRIGYVWAV